MMTITRSMLALGLVSSILAGCAQSGGLAAQNPNTPGATGRTIVPGSTSTVTGDALATENQQKWPLRGR